MGKTLRSRAHATLTAQLRRAREAAGLTQTEVAGRLGRPQSYVAKTESGERRLDVVEFVAFARALEADPAAMVREVDRALHPDCEEAEPAPP